MTTKETDILNKLVNRVEDISKKQDAMVEQLRANTKDTKSTSTKVAGIELTLANWTGGRKVLVWVVGVLLTLGVILSTIYEALRNTLK